MAYDDFFGEGGTGVSVSKPYDPDDEPNPANPGGISNNELRRRQAPKQPLTWADVKQHTPADVQTMVEHVQKTDPGATYGRSGATNRAFDQYHQKNRSGLAIAGDVARFAIDPIGGVARMVGGPVAQALTGPAGAAVVGSETVARAVNNPSQPGAPPGPGAGRGAAGTPTFAPTNPTTPPAPVSDPAAGMPAPGTGGPWKPATADYSGVDQEMDQLRATRAKFQEQLDRLSQVDPFGNQAFIQKATDRAVAQASGTAAMARGGAAAQAGAQRQAVGVQAQTSARGAQDVAEQGRRDAVQAAQLGIETVRGMESVGTQLTNVELKKVDQATQQAEVNLRGYLGGRELDQAERESVRRLAVEVGKIDMERYKTDTQYRMSVDQNLTAIYQSDNALRGVMEQIKAQENLSTGDLVMGLLGMGSGIAQGVVMKSDRRAKFDIHDPDLRDLQDYLGKTKGKLYHYKEPFKPGRKPGLNYGPMAQDLAKSKIGRTVLINDADGQLSVDTGRLALADHAALAALAQEVERLKRRG